LSFSFKLSIYIYHHSNKMIVILTGNELFHTIDFVKKEHRFELIKMLYEVQIEWKETQPYTRKHPP
jgi:hypothetical protein